MTESPVHNVRHFAVQIKKRSGGANWKPNGAARAANGVVWAIAYFVGFVLLPFVTVALQQHTGSFALSFLCIPVLMVAMAIGVTLMVPEHSGKELNEIIV
jgi:hypothetical protein